MFTKYFTCAILAFVCVAFVACVDQIDNDPVTMGGLSVSHHALKVDAAGLPQACTPGNAPECNAVGPGQRLQCDPDNLCRLYTSSDSCTYAGLEGGPKSCTYVQCSNDSECIKANPDAVNQTAVCIVTEQSNKSDVIGECLFAYKTCQAAKGTPCETDGHLVCKDNSCSCSASPDTSKASTELCDSVDNNCDGKTDETFNVGEACDGDDSDSCKKGTWACHSGKLKTECTNESVKDIKELCNGADDDCDGSTDEDFSDLGKECDGDDADKCKLGKFICAGDFKSAVCSEEGKNVTEVCDGKDNTCEGNTDEGCDDDGDGFCDVAMSTVSGAACQAGDCNDAEKSTSPGADELCDGVDNNCDSKTDEGFGLGDACSDGKGLCSVAGTFDKCAVDGKSAVCSAKEDLSKKATEACNGVDDSCDGNVDEGCDDDGDGFCDSSMTYASGAKCEPTDCNDLATSINSSVTETCDGIDNNCDGKTDEGCDDDGDTYCDAAMVLAEGAACKGANGMGTDCNDDDKLVNPGVEEVCATSYDDNCDGKTDVKADGKTPVCDACASVRKVACNTPTVIDMNTEPNAFNNIEVYGCWTNAGAKTLKTKLSAPEVMLVPDAKAGTKYSLQILTTGTGTVAARLHGSCQPDGGSKAVSAYNKAAGKTGTCAMYGASSVSGGIVGEDFIVLDAASAKKVTVQFVCAQ